jgi:putative nucleotidyltransferase with HDIG domain
LGELQENLSGFFATVTLPFRGLTWGSVEYFASVLVVGVGAMIVLLAAVGTTLEAPLWMLLALAGVAFVAEKQSVHVTRHTEASISGLPILFAAVVYGPFDAMLVGACALLSTFGRPYTRWVVWTFSRSLVGGLASVAALVVVPERSSFLSFVIAVAVAAVAEGVTDSCLVATTGVLRRNTAFVETMATMARLLVATVPLHTPVVGVLAYAYVEVSPWSALMFFIPGLASQRLLGLYQEQRRLADDLLTANRRLERASLSFAAGLVAALDARDRYTAGHSAAVAVYARDIATEIGLSARDQQLAHLAGLLHDIGKVGLPLGILEKRGVLTPLERQRMEEHVVIGERILLNVEDYSTVAKIVRHHHERIDGSGYPDGFTSDHIPLLSRIIAVADAYNAMTSGRPYRSALSTDVALARLSEAAGSQFDERIVAAFEARLRVSSEPYRRGACSDFTLEAQRYTVFPRPLAASAA